MLGKRVDVVIRVTYFSNISLLLFFEKKRVLTSFFIILFVFSLSATCRHFASSIICSTTVLSGALRWNIVIFSVNLNMSFYWNNMLFMFSFALVRCVSSMLLLVLLSATCDSAGACVFKSDGNSCMSNDTCLSGVRNQTRETFFVALIIFFSFVLDFDFLCVCVFVRR